MSGSEVKLDKRKSDTMNLEVPDGKKKRVEPISLEDLVEKKKLEEIQKAKPVFMTKAQREKAALEQREKEVQLIKQKQEQAKQARMQFLQDVEQEKIKELKEKANERDSRHNSNRRQNQSKRNRPGDDKKNGKSNNTNNKADEKAKLAKIPIDPNLIGINSIHLFLNYLFLYFFNFEENFEIIFCKTNQSNQEIF